MFRPAHTDRAVAYSHAYVAKMGQALDQKGQYTLVFRGYTRYAGMIVAKTADITEIGLDW